MAHTTNSVHMSSCIDTIQCNRDRRTGANLKCRVIAVRTGIKVLLVAPRGGVTTSDTSAYV